MSTVFVVVRNGVYRHQIVSVQPTETLALGAANRAMDKEPDAWHDFLILRRTVGDFYAFDGEDNNFTDGVIGRLHRTMHKVKGVLEEKDRVYTSTREVDPNVVVDPKRDAELNPVRRRKDTPH